MLLPFVPGLLGNVVKDVFTFGAWIRWALQAGEFLFVFAALYGAGHGVSPEFGVVASASAARFSSFFTGAASPKRGGVARLYQSQSASAT